MTKKELISALAGFGESEQIAYNGDAFMYAIGFTRICGKGQAYMIYKCILPPGHGGRCYCGCKRVYFIPDEIVKLNNEAE